MEELYAVCSKPPADDHDQTELHYGGGASDRSDPAGAADRKSRKKHSQCVLSMCDHDTYGDSPAVSGTNAMGEETGIAIGFAKVWSNYSKSIPLSIVMGMALPIGVLFLNLLFDLKSIKENRYYWFAWFNYLAAALMFLVFYEKGFRMMHANFSWGYMHGMFFVFLMTLIVMVKNIREWWKSWKVIFVIGEIAVFFYHLVCGVNFLMYAVMGNDLAGF